GNCKIWLHASSSPICLHARSSVNSLPRPLFQVMLIVILFLGMWVIRWGKRKKLELKEWDDGWDTDSEEEAADWFSGALDQQAQRDELIEREKHVIQTKGFDLPSAIPNCIIEPVNLGDSPHFQRIRALSSFSVAFFNQKKRRSYLLTLRVIESSTLEMKIYQTRISMEDIYFAQFPNKKRDHVEIFRPMPDYIDLEDSVDSQGAKRKRLDEFGYQVMTEECDAGDATYAACSVCATELYRLMAERACSQVQTQIHKIVEKMLY
ncbi:hypothetical protein Tsubulata_003899, partial [Turnera subulata]